MPETPWPWLLGVGGSGSCPGLRGPVPGMGEGSSWASPEGGRPLGNVGAFTHWKVLELSQQQGLELALWVRAHSRGTLRSTVTDSPERPSASTHHGPGAGPGCGAEANRGYT